MADDGNTVEKRARLELAGGTEGAYQAGGDTPRDRLTAFAQAHHDSEDQRMLAALDKLVEEATDPHAIEQAHAKAKLLMQIGEYAKERTVGCVTIKAGICGDRNIEINGVEFDFAEMMMAFEANTISSLNQGEFNLVRIYQGQYTLLQQEDALLQLGAQIRTLYEMAVAMNDELRLQNIMLEELAIDVEGTTRGLSRENNRLDKILEGQGGSSGRGKSFGLS